MKILVVGSGGREHALAWKFAQSQKVERVFAAPGNGGTASEPKCVNIPAEGQNELERHKALTRFALSEKIDLTVIGPELPLAEGIADTFRAAGLAVIGPGKQAAQLEASKIYSKEFMAQYGVRTAKGSSFTDFDEAHAFTTAHFTAGGIANKPVPLVIKADGLAAGKGVVIAPNLTEAEAALSAFMRNKSLGNAGTSVLLEEFLEGKEVSVLAAVSVAGGQGWIQPFIPARDHKRCFEGAQGPNTGGIGAIAPVQDFSPAAYDDFILSILEPTLRGMKAETMDYRGFIFFGLMVHANRCHLLEYNVRLGDPETQAVLPLMDFDLVDLCDAILSGRDFHLAWKQGAVCAPVAAADGYPGSYRTGDAITIDAAALKRNEAKAFIGGAAGEAASLRTSGGRVLTVSAYGADADEAYINAYRGLEAVSFEGMGFRRDIGREA